jgi:hypothetical protein
MTKRVDKAVGKIKSLRKLKVRHVGFDDSGLQPPSPDSATCLRNTLQIQVKRCHLKSASCHLQDLPTTAAANLQHTGCLQLQGLFNHPLQKIRLRTCFV